MTEVSSGLSSPSVRTLLLRRVSLLLIPAVAMAFVWQVSPLQRLVEPQALADALRVLVDTWWGPPAVIALSVLGCVLMVPLTLLVLAHGAMFSAPANFLVAEASMLLGAVGLYYLGRRAGDGVVERVVPADLQAQLNDLGTKGVLGLAAIRWIPVAHFGLTGMMLGAIRIPLSRFVLGTLIGQTPVVALWVLLGDRVRAGLVDPSVRTLGLLFGVMVSVVMVALAMRWFARWRASRTLQQ